MEDPEEVLSQEQAEALQRYLEAWESACAEATAKLFPRLSDWPLWLVEHIRPRIQRGIASLHASGQSDDRIMGIVTMARDGRIGEIPGSVRDASEFVTSAYDLANIQRALTLDKADAIRELAGSEAAKNYIRSRSGNEARLEATQDERRSRNNNIREAAENLRRANPSLSGNDIARKLVSEFSLGFRQVKRVLKETD